MILASDHTMLCGGFLAWLVVSTVTKFEFVCRSARRQCHDLIPKTNAEQGLVAAEYFFGYGDGFRVVRWVTRSTREHHAVVIFT